MWQILQTAITLRRVELCVGHDGAKSTGQSMTKDCTRNIFKLAIIFALLGVFNSGCGGAATTWSAEARSPDGLWLAIARSQQWGGPGNDYDATTVYLKWVKGSQRPSEILEFSHQYANMHLRMEWITPKHLNVVYAPTSKPGDQVNVDFQAVKCADVEITIQKLTSAAFRDAR